MNLILIGLILLIVGLCLKNLCQHKDTEYIGKIWDWVACGQHSSDYTNIRQCKKCGKELEQHVTIINEMHG